MYSCVCVCMYWGMLLRQLLYVWCIHMCVCVCTEACACVYVYMYVCMRQLLYVCGLVAFLREGWVINECDMNHSWVWHWEYCWVNFCMRGRIRMGHVTYEWVMSRVNEACHIWMRHFTGEYGNSCTWDRIWMSHVTYEWVMSRTNESCHIWMRYVAYECVKSRVQLQYVRGDRDMQHWSVWHDPFISVTWVLSRMNEACHIWMRQVTYECVVSRAQLQYVCGDYDMRHSSVRHDLFISLTWGMSHMNKACHIWMRHVTHKCRHVTYEWGMSHMNAVCHVWIRHVTYECGMSHVNASCHVRNSSVFVEIMTCGIHQCDTNQSE